MPSLNRTLIFVRHAALLAFAACGLHQLRYLAGYGRSAGEALALQGHGYLGVALPGLALLVLVIVLGTLLAAAVSRPRSAPRGSTGPPAPWIAYPTALAGLFALQELAEGAVFAGHPGGTDGIVAHGGWLALPLAALLGALLSLCAKALASVEQRVAGALLQHPLCPPRLRGRPYRRDVRPLAASALAFGLARRAPPSSLLAQ